MAKDAKGHGSEARGGSAAGDIMARLGVTRPEVAGAVVRAAHSQGVDQVGAQPKVLPKESTDSRELRLFADNHADLNRQSLQPIRDNLGKKMDKGIYDPEKAATLWKYHADRAAQAYTKEFGTGSNNVHGSHGNFSPDVRREAAQHWEADERDDIKSGSSRTAKKG
jgi:hypothetical protein